MGGYRRARWRGIVLYGMAGSGKSCIAAGLSHHGKAQSVFYDGVFWVDGSHDPSGEMERLCGSVGILPRCGETWTECWSHWVSKPERRALLILDGADTPEAVRPWVSQIGGQVVVLVTTRHGWPGERELARWLGPKTVHKVNVRGMSHEEGRRLVEAGARHQLADEEWNILQEIGEHLGWHPQTVMMAAAESHLICWQGQADELRSGSMPFSEITDIVKGQCERLEPRQYDWLGALAGRAVSAWFSGDEAARTWQVTEAVAARRLWALSGTGMVEMSAHDPHAAPTEAQHRWLGRSRDRS